jgi:dihydrofolate reductase
LGVFQASNFNLGPEKFPALQVDSHSLNLKTTDMGQLSVFNFITLNGFYKGPNEDISWHKHGGEENEYSIEGLKQDNVLLFGRKTYDLMKSYWPTPEAKQQNPIVAEGMNKAEKIVFSKTLKNAEWENTRVIWGDIIEEVKKMKQDGRDLTLLGSGSILSQFAEHGLIDEYQFMIDPVAIGSGSAVFNGINHNLDLKMISVRSFNSGVVLLSYKGV